MEMDCNQFFKCLPSTLEELLTTDCSLLFLGENISLFSLCSKSNFILEKRFLVKYLSSLIEQHTAKSSR